MPKGEKGEGKAKGEGKGGKGGKPVPKKGPLNKTRALQQIAALGPEDDERRATSKKISWILRRGADRVGIEIDGSGWVKMSDLLASEILDDMPERSEAKFMSIIEESNAQKLRYEMKTTSEGTFLRAFSKQERKDKRGDADEPEESKLQVEPHSGLRAEANAFVPQAASTGSIMPGYPAYPYGFSPFGYGWPYAGYGFPAMPNPAVAAAAQEAASGGTKRYQGRIKSFNAEKGYGFVESVEAYATYNRDVFLHKAHVGDFEVGAYVTFAVESNKQGMPQARDLTAMAAGAVPAGKKGGKAKGKGSGKKDKGKGKKDKEAKTEGTAEALEPGQVNTDATPAVAEDPAPADKKEDA